ncbi:surface antigen family protein [Anaplasma phagocytophilum str. CRT53-1]|uniref:Surface antigen family protein n=1 Tax=Anaplasma phagocytophilum str. CRT53-1 TaxID=1359157 RepID=A0A0F3PVQ2_ANAPH|nr:P44-1 outer membrane protein [Anaplasma phagocytophilum str. CRT35]KJV84001.1 surface antigen family protein [Anaplasma phagocytophilum str. CRT53-1]
MTQKGASGTNSYGVYASTSDRAGNTNRGDVALCGGAGHASTTVNASPQVLKNFVENTLLGNEDKNWPSSTAKGNAETPKPKTNDNAKAVAGDLTKLTPEEKTIVAGLLAKTIEGGEVVEIRAVSSTSVMVNACYDLLSEGLGVVPYACVGLGGNFVGVVDGHITIYLCLLNTLPR